MQTSSNFSSGLSLALKLQRKSLLHVAGFSALINLLMLAPVIYMLQIYDRVLSAANVYTLYMISMLVAGLFLLMGFLEWIRSLILIRISESFDASLNTRVFNAIFRHQLKTSSANPEQLLRDLSQVRQFMTGSSVFAFFDAPWAPVFLVLLFVFHPLLGTLGLIGCVLLLVLALINEGWAKGAMEKSAQANSKASKLAASCIANAEVAEAMGMQPQLAQQWQKIHTEAIASQGAASERSAVITACSKVTRLALQSLILGAGAWLAIAGEITPGMMIAGSIMTGRMLAPVEQLVAAFKQWQGVKIAKTRLNFLLHEYPETHTKLELPAPTGKLSVEGVTLAPPMAKKAVLNNINFQLNAGDVLAVIGPSGAGKSSIARLLAGVWPPYSGHVRLDDADLQQWDRSRLGPHIGYLPQEVGLFAGSIGDNIARFGERDDEAVVTAARLAGVHEMILRLPQGYDTELGPGGAGLSGGEKQRIGLARALYGQPALVILDEPNASQDDAGEAALVNTVKRLAEMGTSVVLITHRSGILNFCDKILLLNQGGVQAFGEKQQVLEAMQKARQPRKMAVV